MAIKAAVSAAAALLPPQPPPPAQRLSNAWLPRASAGSSLAEGLMIKFQRFFLFVFIAFCDSCLSSFFACGICSGGPPKDLSNK
jgi:hypothetical protein